jgi:ubiquinone/menaquinone biosynthesis C-methylase UbiE
MSDSTPASPAERRWSPGQFERIAPWYDALMADVPYDMWLRYVLSLVEIHRSSRVLRVPMRVLDLGCGTGTMTFRFEQHGCQVVGVDISEPMIAVGGGRGARPPTPAR